MGMLMLSKFVFKLQLKGTEKEQAKSKVSKIGRGNDKNKINLKL